MLTIGTIGCTVNVPPTNTERTIERQYIPVPQEQHHHCPPPRNLCPPPQRHIDIRIEPQQHHHIDIRRHNGHHDIEIHHH